MTSRIPRSAGNRRTARDKGFRSGGRAQNAVFYVLLGFLALCLLGGGSNRTTVPSLLYLRPLTVVCLFVMLVLPVKRDFRPLRAPLVLLGLLAATMAVQLVPLPPSIWTRLPGHAPLAGAAILLDGHQPWRPISFTPDFTLNSLLALLVPATVLVGYAGIRPGQRSTLIPLTVGAAVAGAALGIVQFAGGEPGYANLYANHSLGVPNGWFANRNHHAAFLACALVLAGTWLRSATRSPHHERRRFWMAGLSASILFVVVIATGSRTGTLLALPALAYMAAPMLRVRQGDPAGREVLTLRVAVAAGVLALIGVMLVVGRAEALDRLFGFDAAEEQRVQALPTLVAMWRDLMPVGSGFGSFDAAFRMYEPDAMLAPTNFNHAHNDWLELGLTGGLPALAVLLAFIGWSGVRLVRWFRALPSAMAATGRGGGLVLLILGAASVSDYPLRTPLMAALPIGSAEKIVHRDQDSLRMS